jgi:hypothetical protein
MAVASVTTDQILQAYRDTLGRTPGPEEVNFWVNYSTTNDPTQTANAFLAGAQNELASRQAINIPAATSSDLVLNLPTRTTIPAPVDVSSLAATGPVRPVAQPSVTSDQIVESYTKYLNRTPSAEEVSFWTNYSTTNDPTQTANAFLAGAKNEIANVTKSGYESYLGRTPNQEELNFWTNYTVEQGAPQAAAAWKAGADQELAARNVPSSVTEQQILDSYNKFFNRTPSADEVSFWVNYGRTADPTQTANAFINSARKEIGDITKSGYESYLGREPTQQELDFWTNYTIENDAVQAANAWKAGADEELIRRKAAVEVDTTLQNSNLTGSLVSESTAGIPYAGGIYKRTPQEEVMYLKELSRIPVNAAVPLPVMPMSLGPSDALTRARQPGDIGEQAYYGAIRDVVTSGDYTPAQLRQMQRNVGTSGQDINVAFGRGMTPITTTTPTMPGATADTTQSIDKFIQSKAPTTSVAMPTAPSMFSPENVRAQLELERLRLQPTPEPPPEEPVAGFAQGGLVSDDINRMLQNQRNAIQRESQSRQMLTNLGAPPVKKFSDGGPAGSSSGVRRLKMSGYQAGGDVTDEMFVGTTPSEESQQTTGEYIKGLYKENIPVHARVYLETLLGKKDPITADDFTKEELADIEKLLSSKPAKGAVTEYSDYEKVRDLDREGRHSSDWLENLPSVGKTLGRFTYETLPDGRRVIKDTYDFYNTSRSINVQEFEEMEPAEKALAVFKKITASRSMMDPPFVKRAADVLGEAYIGRDGRPVKVEYDPKDLPVKRQEGSPPEGEVNENPYVRMAREERAAQDKAFDSVNRQLSDLLERYKKGNEGITEKDLLPFFPGYNEYDIAQMYGTTTESSVPSMSSKARSFTPEIMSNLRKYDELMQKDFDRLVKEKRLPRDVITARTLGLAKGGEVTNDEFIQEMMVGTRPTDETTSPGILPPEIRQAVDVPLDFANLLIRGTAAVPIGGFAGLYKGLTGGKYGTQEGVKEADTEAARMMAKITGEPKTQAAKDVLEFIGGKAQEYKLDAALPQLLTLPSPGPGAASALMRSYELAETPPLGTVKLAGDKGVKPATPPTDQMGFYSPAEKAVMGLPQDKGTASQMLAQITKTQGVKPVELRATGLEDYLKGKGNEPVTKQEIQDFLTNNRVQVDEVVLGKGQTLSPEAKKLSGEALSRMEEVDDKLASYFEGVEEVAGQDPYSAFIMLRSSIGRRAAKGDQEALDELNAFNLPPEIKDLVLEFGRNKNEYIKYTSQARKMEKPKFDGYNTSGGTNAREIYLTLPGEQMPSSSPPSVNAQGVLVKPMYATQPKFTAPSPHSVSPEADANRLAHIFLDERKDAKGNNVLFVQEMQSDWAQQGRDKGFAIVNKLPEGYSVKQDLIVSGQPWGVVDKNGQFVTAGFHRSKEDAVAEVIQRLNTYKLPTAPFVTNTEDWVNLALKRVIKEAVDNDIDTVAFIKGGQAADKYSLRTFVDHISADRGLATGDDLYVSITPKDSLSPHAFYVGPDGIIKEPISADVRSKFLGEPLSKVIGKETAEKLLSTKIGESQVLRDEGLTLGGKGMEGFYDNILPKTAEKLLKKLGGGKVEPVEMVKAAPSQMPYEANAFLHWMSFRHPGTSRSDAARAWGMGMDNNQFVKEFYEETTPKADQYLGFKITPEMKEMVKTEGLPKFAAGGEVTDFIKRAA